MLAIAGWQTRVLQNGRLRIYILIVMITTVSLVGYRLFTETTYVPLLNFEGFHLYEFGIAVVILLAAYKAVHTQSRLGAVAALGVVGFSIALIYVLYSAPDLAMTQILVETLTVVLFVLILYRLPKYVKLSGTASRIRDAIIALIFGAMMTTLVLIAAKVQLQDTISGFFAENSLPQANGRNIVNVILVDFRALDTMGEITVLSVAALGVFSLLRSKNQKSE
jgi:multicomponent Na+:H+ antiporter subunit A